MPAAVVVIVGMRVTVRADLVDITACNDDDDDDACKGATITLRTAGHNSAWWVLGGLRSAAASPGCAQGHNFQLCGVLRVHNLTCTRQATACVLVNVLRCDHPGCNASGC